MKALVIIFALFSNVVFAEDSWVRVATADDAAYDVKVGSVQKAVMKDGNVLFYAIGKKTENSRVNVGLWTIPASDCIARSGELTVRDMSASKLFSVGFAFGAGNVASGVAEAICAATVNLK